MREASIATRASIAAMLAALGACAPDPPMCEEKRSLVDPEAWRLLPLEEDPFSAGADLPLLPKNADAGVDDQDLDGGPALTLCAEEDLAVEVLGSEESLQLSTQFCSWMTVEQPLRRKLARGDRVALRVWYFAQTSYPAATADVVLAFGDAPFWEASVPIPTEAGLLAETPTLQADVEEGTPIRWHVGNHGGNTWNLIEVSVLHEVPCPTDGGK